MWRVIVACPGHNHLFSDWTARVLSRSILTNHSLSTNVIIV